MHSERSIRTFSWKRKKWNEPKAWKDGRIQVLFENTIFSQDINSSIKTKDKHSRKYLKYYVHELFLKNSLTMKCCLLRDESKRIQEWRLHAKSIGGVYWNYLNREQIQNELWIQNIKVILKNKNNDNKNQEMA